MTDEIENPDGGTGITAQEGTAALVALCIIAAGVYFAIRAVDPGTVHEKHDPGFLDVLVSNRTVIIGIRLTVGAAAAYLGYSCLTHIKDRRPLTHLGPMKAAEDPAEIARETIDAAKELETQLEAEMANTESLMFIIGEQTKELEDLRDKLNLSDDPADSGRTVL